MQKESKFCQSTTFGKMKKKLPLKKEDLDLPWYKIAYEELGRRYIKLKQDCKSQLKKLNRQQKELELQERVVQLEAELELSTAVTSNAEEIQKRKYANATLPAYREPTFINESTLFYDHEFVKKKMNMPDLPHPQSDQFKDSEEAAYYRASTNNQNLREQLEAIRHRLGYHEGKRFPEFFEWCSGGTPCEERPVLQYSIACCNKNVDGWKPKRIIFFLESRVTRRGPEEGLKIYSCYRKGLGTLNNYLIPLDLQKFILGLIIAQQFIEAQSAQSRYTKQEKRSYYISQFGFTDASQQPIEQVYCYDCKFPCMDEGNPNHPGNVRLLKILSENYDEYKRFKDSGTSTVFFFYKIIHDIRFSNKHGNETKVKFVKLDANDNQWKEVGDKPMRDFISRFLFNRYKNNRNV